MCVKDKPLAEFEKTSEVELQSYVAQIILRYIEAVENAHFTLSSKVSSAAKYSGNMAFIGWVDGTKLGTRTHLYGKVHLGLIRTMETQYL